MDATYLNPALKAILNVMEKMAHLHPERDQARIKQNNVAIGDVSSVIEMKGESGTGSVSVSFPDIVIKNLAKRMLPPGMPLGNEILRDLTGEMGNMIAGGMKGELENAGLKFNISLPKIISGSPHHIDHNSPSPVLMLPFNCEIGPFFVEITFADGNTPQTSNQI